MGNTIEKKVKLPEAFCISWDADKEIYEEMLSILIHNFPSLPLNLVYIIFNHCKTLPECGFKLLLWGKTDSGKSTIFKQLKNIYGDGFSEDERKKYTDKINNHIVSQMKELCVIRDCHFDYAEHDTEFKDARKLIDEAHGKYKNVILNKTLAMAIDLLWKDKYIQDIFEERSEYYLNYNVSWLFERIFEISKEDYIPSFDDILRTPIYNNNSNSKNNKYNHGFCEAKLNIKGLTFRIYDVRGKGHEGGRLFWSFNDLPSATLLYVASMTIYDEIVEDESSLVDSLNHWEDWTTNRGFLHGPLILLLTKNDIFKKKIMTSPLKQDRKKYPNYPECNIPQKDYKAGQLWMKQQYLARISSKREVYVYFLCTLTGNNVSDTIKYIAKKILDKGTTRKPKLTN